MEHHDQSCIWRNPQHCEDLSKPYPLEFCRKSTKQITHLLRISSPNNLKRATPMVIALQTYHSKEGKTTRSVALVPTCLLPLHTGLPGPGHASRHQRKASPAQSVRRPCLVPPSPHKLIQNLVTNANANAHANHQPWPHSLLVRVMLVH
jgi:hypothetical protein